MKFVLILLFQALLSLFALSVQGQQLSPHYLKDAEQAKYLAKTKFTCPRSMGLFPDPDDCSWFYMCFASKGARRRCPGFLKFDSVSSQCVMPWMAKCFDGNKESSSSAPTEATKSEPSSTTSTSSGKDGIVVCSSFMGTFPHPNDCSKYYTCMMFIPTVKTCPKKQLFDAVKKSCKSEELVHCGTRKRPAGYTTTEIPSKSTSSNTRIEEKSTDTLTTLASERPDIISKTTEIVVPTKGERPTGPPDHDCDENDLDCIVTETGDVSDWFTCPENVGSYPHPSSDKLFIFCMNWTPSVKKCGIDLVFSKELLTCVNALYLL